MLPSGIVRRASPATEPRPTRRPIVWVTLGLLCGQAVAASGGAPWIGVAAGVLSLLCVLIRGRSGLVLAVALLAAAAGTLQVDRLLRPRFGDAHVARGAGTEVALIARVVEPPVRQRLRTRLLLEVEALDDGDTWRSAVGRVLVTVQEADQAWQRGDRLRARLRLRRPRNFGNPGEFDYETYLALRGVYVTAFARSDRSWARHPADGSGALALLDGWRAAVAAVLEETLKGTPQAIVAALVIGDMAALPPEVHRRYARTGLSHVLSISGLHVGLVAGAAQVICRWLLARSEWVLLRTNVPKLCTLCIGLPVLAYAGIAGFAVPTVRAVVMVLLFSVGLLFDRQRDWIASLAGAALGVSLLWPGAVLSISFQLSFASVLAIVLGMKRLTRRWMDWEERHLIRLRPGRGWRALRWSVLYLGVTLCATAGTAPLTAWHFNLVSLVSVVANPLIVPLLGFVPVGLGLLAALVLPLSCRLSSLLFAAVGGVVAVADGLVARLAAAPGAAIRVVSPSLPELALFYGVLGVFLATAAGPARRALLALCALGVGVDVAYWSMERWHRDQLRISFLSVGQGDSAVIEFPGSFVMVVDGGGIGGGFDVGERLIAPYLWRRKIAHVDVLVLTHPQFDHYGGLAFLARAFSPDALWWDGARGSGARFEEFRSTLAAEGVPTVAVRQGFHRVIGGVDVLVLWPDETTAGDPNNRSVTLRLRYGPTTVLLPGDLEADGERRLVATAGAGLASAILKVPHHGGRTSSTAPFLDAVAPRWAIISAGHQNRFGLPHPRVLAAYAGRGTEVWRTDRQGAITVRVQADGTVTVHGARDAD